MEVVVPAAAAAAEFHFDSTSTSPYVSAPSSPKRFGEFSQYYYYNSAPTSPSRAAAIYNSFNNDDNSARRRSSPSSVIPFDWEEGPDKTESHEHQEVDQLEDFDEDFAFEFSGQLEMGSPPPLTAADELFEEGKIRPLKPPPGLLQHVSPTLGSNDNKSSTVSSQRSPKSPRSRIFPLSPRRHGGRKQEDADPALARAIEEKTRGRERANPPANDNRRGGRRATRSLSPLGLRGVFDFGNKLATTGATTGGDANNTAGWIKGGSKKWRLRDLLLFRSASEGRATGGRGSKDLLRKYTALSPSSSALLSKRSGEDSTNASFRSTEGSVGGSSRRGVSAHERHYTANRAVSEEKKRKTMLPYGRQGLFGCLVFNPAIHGLAKGFTSFSRGGGRQS